VNNVDFGLKWQKVIKVRTHNKLAKSFGDVFPKERQPFVDRVPPKAFWKVPGIPQITPIISITQKWKAYKKISNFSCSFLSPNANLHTLNALVYHFKVFQYHWLGTTVLKDKWFTINKTKFEERKGLDAWWYSN
jgi:hypothetical protein